MSAMIWVETHINLVNDRGTEAEAKNLEVAPRKENIMKALQIDNYKKKRIDTFDFAYLGETEDFSLTL